MMVYCPKNPSFHGTLFSYPTCNCQGLALRRQRSRYLGWIKVWCALQTRKLKWLHAIKRKLNRFKYYWISKELLWLLPKIGSFAHRCWLVKLCTGSQQAMIHGSPASKSDDCWPRTKNLGCEIYCYAIAGQRSYTNWPTADSSSRYATSARLH